MIFAALFSAKVALEVLLGAVPNEKQLHQQPKYNFSTGKCPLNEFKGLFSFFSGHLNEGNSLFAIGKKGLRE